jgi:hypothetical protein|tara:strand:+ start:272 stop:547 length:276 start_codon:yes stop_codon:yes gene_type:complete
MLRFLNIACGVLLAIVYPIGFLFASNCTAPASSTGFGVVVHTSLTHLCINFGNIVLCCYAIIFAAMMILFEARVGGMHKGLRHYFGFMFSW